METIRIAKLLLNAAEAIEAKQPHDPSDLGENLLEDPKLREKIAYDTSLRRGVVDQKAIVPRLVGQLAKKTDKILDFGAGAHATQTLLLRKKGLDVTAYDFPKFANPEVHDLKALDRQYDIVFASNVINVSSDQSMLLDTLRKIKRAVKPGGFAVFNYPADPRKWKTSKFPKGIPAQIIRHFVEKIFGQEPELLYGTNSVPVWKVGA